MFDVPPSLFENISISKSAKDIWDSIQDMFKGSDNVKDKRLASMLNDFDIFTTTLGETVSLTSNQYKITVNQIIAHGVVRTPL